MAFINNVDPPPLGDTNYVNKINDSLTAIDEHDHTPGKGKPVAVDFSQAPTITGLLPFSNIFSWTDDASAGAVNALFTTNRTLIRLTGAVTAINGITNAYAGKLIAIYNDTGASFNVNNLDAGAVASDQILTGTGATLVLAAGQLALFIYQDTDAKWLVVAGGGGGASFVESNLTTSTVTLTSSGAQRFRYTGGSAQTISSIDTSACVPNTIVEFYGTSDSNTLKLQSLSNLKLNGACELGEYSVIQFRFDATENALIEIARNDG